MAGTRIFQGQHVRGWVFLVAGIAAYVGVQAFFFPSYYSQADSGCYVSMAYVFAQGKMSGEGLDMNLYRFMSLGGRLVGVHDPGMGWLLAPFTVFGPRGLFAFNMLLYLAGFVVFYLLLRRIGVHPAFSLLYLLHPTLWYHSRTIVNDFPSGVLFLIGLYCFVIGGRALMASGFFWGLALFVRPAAGIFVGAFLLVWFVQTLLSKPADRQSGPGYPGLWKKVGMLAIGAIPPLFLYNVLVLHSLTGILPGRYPYAGPMWSLAHVPLRLLRYGIVLNVFYPLMLIVFFLYRGRLRWPLTGALIGTLAFYSLCYFYGYEESILVKPLDALVKGLRYFEGILPVMVLTYAWVLHRLAGRFGKPFWALYAAGVCLLCVAVLAITVVHQRHMDQSAYFRDQLFGNTPKGSLILMDEVVRTRISADVTRPRRLLTVFPLESDPAHSIAELDGLLDAQGEAYVPELRPGGEMAVSPQAAHDRDAFIGRHPHEVVLDVEKGGWRLELIRVKPGGAPRGSMGQASEQSGHGGESPSPGNPAAAAAARQPNGRGAISEGTF